MAKVFNLNSRLRNAVRRVFLFSPLRRAVMARCKVGPLYRCEACGETANHLDVDHVIPVVNPETGFVDWSTFIDRLFCSESGLAGLCEQCHKKKTAAEEALRKQHGTGRYSQATRQRMTESQTGRTDLRGKPKSVEHRLAMSKSRKGKPQTPARTVQLAAARAAKEQKEGKYK